MKDDQEQVQASKKKDEKEQIPPSNNVQEEGQPKKKDEQTPVQLKVDSQDSNSKNKNVEKKSFFDQIRNFEKKRPKIFFATLMTVTTPLLLIPVVGTAIYVGVAASYIGVKAGVSISKRFSKDEQKPPEISTEDEKSKKIVVIPSKASEELNKENSENKSKSIAKENSEQGIMVTKDAKSISEELPQTIDAKSKSEEPQQKIDAKSKSEEPKQTIDAKSEKLGIMGKLNKFYDEKPVLTNSLIFAGSIALAAIPVIGPFLTVATWIAQASVGAVKYSNSEDKAEETQKNLEREQKEKFEKERAKAREQMLGKENQKSKEPTLETNKEQSDLMKTLTQRLEIQDKSMADLLAQVKSQSEQIQKLQATLVERGVPTFSERRNDKVQTTQQNNRSAAEDTRTQSMSKMKRQPSQVNSEFER